MSTTAEQTTSIPTGTWSLDPVHSDVGFAVNYSGAGTVRGGFKEFDAKLVDGKLEGSRQGRERHASTSRSSSATSCRPTSSTPSGSPSCASPRRRSSANGDEVTIDGELTLRGVTKPVTITGTVVGPTPDAGAAGPIQRLAFDIETKVDRRDFGIDWNRDLPSGDPALSNDVTITANLALVQA